MLLAHMSSVYVDNTIVNTDNITLSIDFDYVEISLASETVNPYSAKAIRPIVFISVRSFHFVSCY